MVPSITEAEKQKLLKMSEVSIWIDHYDDIFSDFDPRPYSQRGLSDDFLAEAKKFTKERSSGDFELILLVPHTARKMEQENMIKKRLHEHFKKHEHLLKTETAQIKKKGILLAFFGMLIMFGATLLTTMEETFLVNLFFVILEPSGWFMTWVGFEKIFSDVKEKQPDLDFYNKMTHCEIKFKSY